MKKLREPTPEVLGRTIQACIDNGARLVRESYDLEFNKPPSSRFYLVIIAQEEFAKAFMLFLVKEQIIPFNQYILRAMKDHVCKQLVGVIMDYITMHWEDIEDLRAMIRAEPEDAFPPEVASAMNLLRYEKIKNWEFASRESACWFWVEDPVEDRSTLRILEGKKDQHKQDALYVRIGSDGRVCSTPQIISDKETEEELKRAQRYNRFAQSLLDGGSHSYRYNKATAVLNFLFCTPNGRAAP